MKEHKIRNTAILAAIGIAICAILFVDKIWLAATIVSLATINGIRLTIRYAREWWRQKQNQVAKRERFIIFLVSLMWFFFCTGTVLFMWAFFCINADNNGSFLFINAEYLLRSFVCSFQLFTGSIDSNVLDEISNHQFIKGLISIQAVLSFLCTVAVVLSLAIARLKAYYLFHRKTSINDAHNHLYVFFGINTPSTLLAKSIRTNDEKAILLFVENNNMGDESQEGWNSIIGFFTHKRQTFLQAEELGARVTFTEIRLCDVDKEKLIDSDVLSGINLRKLKGLILELKKYGKDAQLHCFFLSDNGDENIRAMSILASDITVNSLKNNTNNNKVKLRIYCHARRNDLNRIVEDIAFKHGIDVRTIDSSYLAVELLKNNSENHPVRLIDIDEKEPTTVKSSFNSLIIGFDEVGRDALKFLYEFGAFVDHSAYPTNDFRSPFHCVVIDRRMSELEGSFVNSVPAVIQQVNHDGNTPLVEFKSCDCQGKDFYDVILNFRFCTVLNYIVIAVGDDELGMTLAIRIMNHIRRVRPDLHKLRIYVRSYRPDKEAYMQKIATYYNEGYNNCVTDNSFKVDSVIRIFGQAKDIYSYETVVNEVLTQKGRKYQESYARLRRDSTTWDSRRLSGQKKGSLDSIRKLRRQELQDLGNALHADTKVYLLKKAMQQIKGEDYDWENFFSRYFDSDNMPYNEGEYDKIKYILLDDDENKAIMNLARLEHMRWNASHEMLGYTKAHTGLHQCDERTREHNCLRPWHELDNESLATLSSDYPCDYKLFDYSVVDNSILLNKDKLL